MNKVVRNKVTSLYLKPDGTWTRRLEEAQRFNSVLLAIDRINHLLLRDCEIVFKANQEKFDLALPVTPVKPAVAFSRATQRALEQA